MIEALPVEIWRQFVLFMELIDEFYFSCASKLTFEICYGNKKFKVRREFQNASFLFTLKISISSKVN